MNSLLHFRAVFVGGKLKPLDGEFSMHVVCDWEQSLLWRHLSLRHHLYIRHYHSEHNLHLRQWSKISVYTLLHVVRRYTTDLTQLPWTKKLSELLL